MPLLLSETKAQCWALSCAAAFELLGHHRRVDEPVRHLRSNGVSRGCSSGDICAQGAHHLSGRSGGPGTLVFHTHTTHTHTRKSSSLTTLLLAVGRVPKSTASVYPWLRGMRVMARRGGCAIGSTGSFIDRRSAHRPPLLASSTATHMLARAAKTSTPRTRSDRTIRTLPAPESTQVAFRGRDNWTSESKANETGSTRSILRIHDPDVQRAGQVPDRLTVRISGSHPGDQGSIPCRGEFHNSPDTNVSPTRTSFFWIQNGSN
jgi:hypothetical protein